MNNWDNLSFIVNKSWVGVLHGVGGVGNLRKKIAFSNFSKFKNHNIASKENKMQYWGKLQNNLTTKIRDLIKLTT